MLKLTLAALALCAAGSCAAQAVPASKQALVDRVLAKMHTENVGLAMLQAPVAESIRQSRAMLQGRATPEKAEAAMKDITAEAEKFFAKNAPLVRASTQTAVKTKLAPMLAEKFSEDELKQLVAFMESPIRAKFEALAPELQKTIGESVAAQLQGQIKPEMAALQERIGLRLRAAVTP